MPTPEPPSYFSLTRDEQQELLQGAAYRTPWSTKMLEKDVWVVWTLDALFRQPNAPTYAFKGGTCLSKVYGATHRFSEDVDITLEPDHPTYLEGLDPMEPGATKNQLKKRGDRARAKLPEYLTGTLVPYLSDHSGLRPAQRFVDAGDPQARPPWVSLNQRVVGSSPTQPITS